MSVALAEARPARRAGGARSRVRTGASPRTAALERRAVTSRGVDSQAFWKLSAVVVCLGGCACGLLAMRQARLQAAHELAEARLRVLEHDERLLLLRAEIGRRISPEGLESVLASLDRDVPGFRSRLEDRWLLGERPALPAVGDE